MNTDADAIGGVTSANDVDQLVASADLEVTQSDRAGDPDSQGTFFTSNSTLYTFNGAGQLSALTSFGSTLFGETYGGGPSNDGMVYSINTDGTGFTILHSFDGTDGDDPSGGLAISSDGSTLYGVTIQGGANDDGEVFSLTTDGTFTVLYVHSWPRWWAAGGRPDAIGIDALWHRTDRWRV